MASVGERRLGSYKLVSPLATGGMAELFIAKTAGVSGFEKQVALKVIHPNFSSDPDFVRMLVDEAKLSVQLQHANIVQTYDLGHVDGQYYIAMELIDGADLYKVLKTASERGLDFPLDVAAFVAAETATGLDYAHRKADPMGRPLKIVHRDVSPQNVLISIEGEVKIVDFGIAKAALRNQQTQAGVIKGKYFYMSPEQAWGTAIDARSDVFSTGILLYEMLVGEMLYLEEDIDRLLKMVRAADIQPPSRKRSDIPRELDAIVMKALAKRPEDRFQTAADMATALTRFLRQRFPDFGRSRAATFVREVLEREASRADITPPPPKHHEFGDENSLIFDLKNNQRLSAKGAHRAAADPGDNSRHKDQDTRDVAFPHAGVRQKGSPNGDYDEPAATEFDPRPLSSRDRPTDPDVPASTRKGPSGYNDYADPGATALAAPSARRDAAPGFDNASDDESTHHRSAERPRRPVAPAAPPTAAPRARRTTLPPVASLPPTPRAAMGLGVTEPMRNEGRPPSREIPRSPETRSPSSQELRAEAGAGREPRSGERRVSASTPIVPTPPSGSKNPSYGGTPASGAHPGAQPLVDWSAAATVTPSSMGHPYTGSASESSGILSERSLPDLRRRKLMLRAALLLVVALTVLGVALIWPEGPGHGSIEVVSVPPGATVRIDGTVLSKPTPIRIGDVDLRQPHHLAVSLRGYDTWENDAKFDSGERELRLRAVLVPAVGSLEIKTVPPGAEVIVNGRISGSTPTQVGDLPPNEDVTLELRLRGYKVVYKTLPWDGKRTLSVSIPLEKAK